MTATNRPAPPESRPIGRKSWIIQGSFSIADWLGDENLGTLESNHGLSVKKGGFQQGWDQKQSAAGRSGGVFFALFAVRNNDTVSREWRCRLVIDGSIIEEYSENVPAGEERGVALCGMLFFRQVFGSSPREDELCGAHPGYMGFEDSLLVEDYVEVGGGAMSTVATVDYVYT